MRNPLGDQRGRVRWAERRSRRSVLRTVGAAVPLLLGGCLGDDDGGSGFPDDYDVDGGEYDGDPADLYEVHDDGIPRAVGDRPASDSGGLAYVVASDAEAERVFTQADVATEARRERNRRFLEATDFDRQVLLQVEHSVPNPNYDLELRGVDLDGSTMVVRYRETKTASRSGPSAEVVRRLCFRVAVETGSISSFRIRSDEEQFAPVSSRDL